MKRNQIARISLWCGIIPALTSGLIAQADVPYTNGNLNQLAYQLAAQADRLDVEAQSTSGGSYEEQEALGNITSLKYDAMDFQNAMQADVREVFSRVDADTREVARTISVLRGSYLVGQLFDQVRQTEYQISLMLGGGQGGFRDIRQVARELKDAAETTLLLTLREANGPGYPQPMPPQPDPFQQQAVNALRDVAQVARQIEIDVQAQFGDNFRVRQDLMRLRDALSRANLSVNRARFSPQIRINLQRVERLADELSRSLMGGQGDSVVIRPGDDGGIVILPNTQN